MSENTEENNTNADSKPYDLKMINAICDNNPQFMEKLLVVFADNIIIDMQALKDAAAGDNWAEVAQMAHKMKSSLMHFSVNSLKDTIRTLEHYQNTDVNTLKVLVAEFDTVVNNVLKHLKLEFPAVFDK